MRQDNFFRVCVVNESDRKESECLLSINNNNNNSIATTIIIVMEAQAEVLYMSRQVQLQEMDTILMQTVQMLLPSNKTAAAAAAAAAWYLRKQVSSRVP